MGKPGGGDAVPLYPGRVRRKLYKTHISHVPVKRTAVIINQLQTDIPPHPDYRQIGELPESSLTEEMTEDATSRLYPGIHWPPTTNVIVISTIWQDKISCERNWRVFL